MQLELPVKISLVRLHRVSQVNRSVTERH